MRANRIQRTLSLLASSLGLLSCGFHSPSSQVAIFGGRPAPVDQRLDAVAVTDNEGVFCSGTAVSPSLVLTAAHCLEGRNAEELRIYVGPGESGGAQIGQYAVKTIAISPDYDPQDQYKGYDAGYILLAEPIHLPASAFTKVLTDSEEIKELLRGGSSSYFVGFGWNKKSDFGIKLEAKGKVRHVEKTEVLLGGEGRDACQGDSGGPAYGRLKSGEWRVYGITSGGAVCGQGGYWGLMHKNICWAMRDSGVAESPLPIAFCEAQR